MLAVKSARIRQLAGGGPVEEPATPRIDLQPRFRIDSISKHDKALADSFLKREASAARGSQPLLRRVKSKLTRPDKAVTLKVLCNIVQNDSSAQVAQIYIDSLSLDAAQSALPFELPDSLLFAAIRNANVDLVRLLAPYTAEEAVTAALESAVLGAQRGIVTALLEYGADPNGLSDDCLVQIAKADLHLLDLILRAPKQLHLKTYGNLCLVAIRNGYSHALSTLLRSISDHQSFRDGPEPWNRDSLLDAATTTPDKTSFFAVAASTCGWPLRDNRLFLQVLDAPAVDCCLVKDMLEALLCLSDVSSPAFQSSPEIQATLCRCIQHRQDDILRLMVSYSVRVSAEPLVLVCQNEDMTGLDILLKGDIRDADHVVARISNLQRPAHRQIRQKIMGCLLAGEAGGNWKHDELVTAAAEGQVHWVDTLMNANASVDYRNGAALQAAVSLGHVAIVRKLLSRQVSLQSLQVAFPSVCQLEPLPRRLLTKVFINQGLTGQCLDDALNSELCNYSYHRDPELVSILIDAGGHCNNMSLEVAFDHADADILDRMRLSRTILHESASQWFRSWHRVLFNHIWQNDGHAAVSSACLKMILSKLGALEDLCETHDGHRRYECFHQFLEHGVQDVDLLSACLRWGQHMDNFTFTELVLTTACFCDLDTVNLVLRSRPLSSPLPSSSMAFAQKLTSNPKSTERPNQFSSVQIPPLLQATRGFLDARSAEAMKIVFRQHLHGTCESHLVTRLLERQLRQCAQSFPEGEDWPILTIQYLLSQPIEVTLPEFISCLQIAIASQRWLVLESLLDRQLPRDMVSSFFLGESSSLTHAALHVLLESQAVSCMEDDFFPDTLQRAFNHACFAQEQEVAILLCTKSRCRLRIMDVLSSLQQAIDASELEYVSTLLSATTSTINELDVLWRHVSQQHLREEFTTVVEMLLKAGADGSSVATTLIHAVQTNDECLITLILTLWQTPRLAQLREEFDYPERKSAWKLTSQAPDTEYFSVLARALSVAVRLGRTNICRLLCNAGAPLVHQRQSLIELAVVVGSQSAMMELIRNTKACPDMLQAVNFALLQVVVHNRPAWIHSLTELGGSVGAYDSEALKVAAGLDQATTLATLLSYNPSLDGLYAVYQILEDRLAKPRINLDNLCAMLEQLHKAGLTQQEPFEMALLALSGLQSTCLTHVDTLIKCGASVDFGDGECMMQIWKQGNVNLFPDLLSRCTQQPILTRLLNEASQDYLRRGEEDCVLSERGALLVFGALLERDLPQELLDSTFDEIARVYDGDNATSSLVIQLFLEKGARFIDGAGLPLYRVCRNSNSEIISLVTNSNPSMRTRFSALYHLFRNQDWHFREGSTDLYKVIDDLDQACLYNINFPTDAQFDELESSDIISLLGAMLHPRGQRVGTNLLFSFFFMSGGLRLLTPRSCCDDDRNEVEQMIVNAITNADDEKLEQRIEFLLRVIAVDALNGAGVSSNSTGFALKEDALNRLLLLALQHKKPSLVDTLLETGASSHATDEGGRSALHLATVENDLDTMQILINNGAKPNDGSLHVATCWQHHEAMHMLLQAGHSPTQPSELFQNVTPLEGCLQFNHRSGSEDSFAVTLAVLLCDVELPADFWSRDPSPLSLALIGSSPYEMFSTMLDLLHGKVAELPLVRQDGFMLSILSLVERGHDLALSDLERVELSTRLEELDFTRTYYALEGDQPEDAVNVPEELEAPELRARRRAWREKDCAVCLEKPEDRHDIHGALSPLCGDNHGWDDEIICTDCLHGHLESQMFPQLKDKDRFPSAKVKCWAPNCNEFLTHNVIQEFAELDRFAVYDASLVQLFLNNGANTAKCAVQGCIGATWLDEDEDKDVTIITCPVCSEDTCIQCNQLYDKHRDEPCPQGEEARGVERRRDEEMATAELMAKGKKCPKCALPYEKITGCDHIVCGKDAHSVAASVGCGYQFCYLCGADYAAILKQGNTAHTKGCSHYA